jgi:di/tricarboxylate transporter
VLIVSIFAIGAAVASCGLLYRLALWVVLQARGSYSGQVAGLGLAGLLLGPAVPNATARVSFIAPAITEMAEALGYPPGSRAAAGLAMAVLVGFGQMVGTFPTSSSTALLAYAVLPEAARSGLDWGTWMLRALPAHAIILLGLLAAVIWLYRPARGEGQPGPASDALALQRTLLGPPSRRERIAALVVVFLLMGFVTQPLHGVDPAWLGAVAFVALTATGVVTAETLRAVNWNFVLLFGVLASMGEVFASTKLDQWLAGLVAGLLGGLASTPVLFVGVLALVCFGLSLVLRWQAAVPLLTITLAPLAGGTGIDPWVVAMVALLACNGFWLPHQSTIYLALYHGTGGRLFSHEQARPVALAYWLLTLLGLCASVPFWHLLGLL